MVRTLQQKALILTLESPIQADLVVTVLNTLKEGEEEWPSDDSTSDSEGKDKNTLPCCMTSLTVPWKSRFWRFYLVVYPRACIEKSPVIGAYLLHCVEEKRFKQHF
ncbi:hypothetical protein VP01_6775g2 [Puccinia sorghi]|uniref:Uncharacterized protein n=1 Tax=Puccinia sorghi TaxID=27349 RepID=A0A0L6UFF9_9BASI|nr:hypothetical protein VP01_6775g2 [Puccinia sorghi]